MRYLAILAFLLAACGGGGAYVPPPAPPEPPVVVPPNRIVFLASAQPVAGDAYGKVVRETTRVTIYVWDGAPENLRPRILAHQLGHAMGVQDSTDFRCAMYPNVIDGEWTTCGAMPDPSPGLPYIVTMGSAGWGLNMQDAMDAWGGGAVVRFTVPGDPPLP